MKYEYECEMCCVYLRVDFNTQLGEEVYLMGENDEVGNWKLERAIQLHSDPLNYPIWQTDWPIWIRKG